MARLMISHGGALGDNGYILPALNGLRKLYDEIYMCGLNQAFVALAETELVDRFIVKPIGFESWDLKQQRDWLIHEVKDIDFDAKINFNGVIPGRYMFHAEDPKSEMSLAWKRDNVSGVSFFDAMSERAINSTINPTTGQSILSLTNPIGKRPETKFSANERIWLNEFRNEYGIPDGAFLLGWQFTGSAKIKWYPFFDEVIQHGIMNKYPQVYVVGLGDINNKIKWDYKYHRGRFINLGNRVSFRQAYILTSILNCLVSPETGLMVFAQCFSQVPKILLATHSYGYHYSFPETIIVQSESACSPCYKIVNDCIHDGDNPWSLCMGKIAPEKVIETIEKVISSKLGFVPQPNLQISN
jgi:ADP-heptose:LPS heptosyltransferase